MADQTNNAASAPAAELPNVPESWPGGFGAYKYSKQAVKRNGNAIGLLILLSFALSILTGFFKRPYGDILSTIVSFTIEIGLISAYIAGVRGNKISFSDALKKIQPIMILKIIAVGILMGILLGLSLLALIVPFFFVLPRIILSTYYLIDRNLGVLEAISTSWNTTKGHAAKVWGIIGVYICIALLAITIIGFPFAVYFYVMFLAGFAVAYEFINKSAPKVAVAPAATPAPSPKEVETPEPSTEPEKPSAPEEPAPAEAQPAETPAETPSETAS